MIRSITFFLALLALSFVAFLFFFDISSLPDVPLPYTLDKECPFDNPKVIEAQQISESEHVRAILNFRPTAPGALLTMPKRHVRRFEDLNMQEWQEIHAMIVESQKRFERAFGTSDYVLMLQNGYYGGQTVDHVHFHMIPRGKDSTLMKKVKLWYILLSDKLNLRPPLNNEQLKTEAERLK